MKREFESGSVRDADDNKPLPMELNPYMLLRYGYHMKRGALNYGKGNWELGQPNDAVWESFSRHFTQAYFNYKFPELAKATDDGTDHLSACIFAINMLMHNESMNGVVADRYFRKEENVVENSDNLPTLKEQGQETPKSDPHYEDNLRPL